MWVALVIGIIVAIALAVLSLTLMKTRKQAKLMRLQSLEIQKHVKELQLQNEELEKLAQEKLQVISLVSHDLKGPFNRIFALIQLLNLTQENLTSDQKEYLGKIHQIAADGLTLVRNILDSRRLEEKGVELNEGVFDFSSIVTALVKNYKIIAEKKKIEIKFESVEPILMKADRLYLGRIIENLLSNAIKFSPEEKSVVVKIVRKPDFVELSVKDQGPGISKEDQKNYSRDFNSCRQDLRVAKALLALACSS